MIFDIQKSSHWYSRDGGPVHTVKAKSGEERFTTLRDARKLELVPSVTSIISIMSNPFLEAWKAEQAVLSSLTLPRKEGESESDFAKRVVHDSREQSKSAMAKGTEVHDFIENAIKNKIFTIPSALEDAGLLDVCDKVKNFILDETLADFIICEESLASKAGFGGKVDFLGYLKDGRLALIDWKTQYVKSGKEATFYDTWKIQLAAYKKLIEENRGRLFSGNFGDFICISVAISTNIENSSIFIKEWDPDDISKASKAFDCLLDLWAYMKGYDPSF